MSLSIDNLKLELKWLIQSGDRFRQDVIAGFQKGEGLRILRWMQEEPRRLIQSSVATELLELLEKPEHSPEEWISISLEIINRKCEDWTPEHSTNPFSNILHEEELMAYREIRKLLRKV